MEIGGTGLISLAPAPKLTGEVPGFLQDASDEMLMSRFQDGDESAFELLFNRYQE